MNEPKYQDAEKMVLEAMIRMRDTCTRDRKKWTEAIKVIRPMFGLPSPVCQFCGAEMTTSFERDLFLIYCSKGCNDDDETASGRTIDEAFADYCNACRNFMAAEIAAGETC